MSEVPTELGLARRILTYCSGLVVVPTFCSTSDALPLRGSDGVSGSISLPLLISGSSVVLEPRLRTMVLYLDDIINF